MPRASSGRRDAVPWGGSTLAHIWRTGAKLRPLGKQTGTRNKVYLQPDAVRVLEQHGVVARRPCVFGGAANDARAHLAEQSGAFVYVLTRAGSQAEMVQADPLLDEPFAGQRGIAWLDADRSPRADAVENLVDVAHQLQLEIGQVPTIDLPGNLDAAHRHDHVRHSVDFGGHRSGRL